MNNVSLIGRLTADPELRYTNSGIAVTSFNLAVDRTYTDSSGEKKTDFIPIRTWRGLAETVANNLKKGRLIGVTGEINVDSWESENGTRWTTTVTADSVKFLDYPKEETEQSNKQVNKKQNNRNNSTRGGKR